jgi:hypothetical protein
MQEQEESMLRIPVEMFKRRRRRGMLPRERSSRTLTGVVAAVLLVAIIGTAALLNGRSRDSASLALVKEIRAERMSPLALLSSAARTHRFLFLSDVPGSNEPKLLAANAIDTLAQSPGLDMLVLEAPATEQPYIDNYLDSNPENAAIVMARSRLLGNPATAQATLALYRRVWKLNRVLGASRQIRIALVDVPNWPPTGVERPRTTAGIYASRDRAMFDQIEKNVIARNPHARVLAFVSTYHALKNGVERLRFGGGEPIAVTPLAELETQQHPGEVYSVLVDAPSLASSSGKPGTVGATKVFDIIRRNMPDAGAPFGVRVGSAFDGLREPIYENAVGGVKVDIEPDDYHLRDVVDGYIYLGYGTRLQ